MTIQQLDLGAVYNTLAQKRSQDLQAQQVGQQGQMNALQMARYQREDDKAQRQQSALSQLSNPNLDEAGRRSILGEAFPELLAQQAFREQDIGRSEDGTMWDKHTGKILSTQSPLDGETAPRPAQTSPRPTLAPGGHGPVPMPVHREELPTARPSANVPAVYQPTIDMHAERTGLSGDLIGRVFMAESGGRKDVVNGQTTSSAGAVGPMQTMPDTLRDPGYGVQPAKDGSVDEKFRVGTDYLAAMVKKYNGNQILALGAYNWGPNNVDKWIAAGGDMSKVPAETKTYIKKILGDDLGLPKQQTAAAQPQAQPAGDEGWLRVRNLKGAGISQDAPPGMMWVGRRRPDGSIETKVAPIPGSGGSVSNLTPEEVAKSGLPEGTVAQRDASGKVTVLKEGEKAQTAKDVAEVERGWRSDFKDQIKQSRELTSQLGIIRNSTSRGDGTGDIASIVAFNKLLDPGAVVREADVSLTLQAQGLGDQLQTWMANKKEGDILPPELRIKMRELAEQIHGTSNAYLRDGVMTYREAIEHGGGNFDRVLPPQMRKSLGWDDQPDPKDATPGGKTSAAASHPELPPGFKVIGG